MIEIINTEHFNKVISEVQEKNLFNKLNEKLEYLGNYGQYNESYEFKVLIGYDSSKWSFSVCWMRRKNSCGEFKEFMYGGLIYFETDQTWSTHT